MKDKLILSADGISFSYCLDKLPPPNLDIRHCHDTYEILYMGEGAGVFHIEDRSYEIKPGDLLFIPPFEYHFFNVNTDIPYERYVINFSPSSLFEGAGASLLRIIGSEEAPSGKVYPAKILPQNIHSIFGRIREAQNMPQGEMALYLKMLNTELIMLLSGVCGEKAYHSVERLGARVIKFLNENIDKNISLDHLARRFFVSKYYLCRAFKKHNGISIHGYINQKRVMYAKQLIESGETASGAAYRVGFGDYSAFYRAYVKIVGRAPTSAEETPKEIK